MRFLITNNDKNTNNDNFWKTLTNDLSLYMNNEAYFYLDETS